jgi:sporulation-control protein spo0M
LTVRGPQKARQKKPANETINCPTCKSNSDTKTTNPKPYLILYPPKKLSVLDKDTLDEMRVSNANMTRKVMELEVELDTQKKRSRKELSVLEARVEDGERRLVEAAKRLVETTKDGEARLIEASKIEEMDVKLETASFVFTDDEEEEEIICASSSFKLTEKLTLSPGGSVVIH